MFLMMNRILKRLNSPRKALFFIGAFILICALFFTLGSLIYGKIHPTKYISSAGNVLEVRVPYIVNGEIDETVVEIPRGTKVQIEEIEEDQSSFRYEGTLITLDNSYLKDSVEECLVIDNVYPRRLVNLREKKDGTLSEEIVKKGEEVRVVQIDPDDLDTQTGEIAWYKVEKDGKEYWLNGKYVETSEDLATKTWVENITYSTYWDEYYGEGYSKDAFLTQIDYKPTKNHNYENNPMLENCNAVHVSLEYLIKYKDYYLNLSKETGINAYVVELKGDSGYVWYQSEVLNDYLKDPEEALQGSLCSLDELQDLIEEFQDAGYYMIGRIVTFKDVLFASQNTEESITDTSGQLIMHNNEYWPSAYSRKAWMYNVEIAKEIASTGINEIQFDYVRFPDGLVSKSDQLDLKNTYNESKTAALQGFLQYASDELEPYEVYVAADVFAWPLAAQDDQDIGQFFLAMANCVDVICPMPYSDHFSAGALGIDDPSSDPGEVLARYTELAEKELSEIEDPPVYRSWIQGYGDLTPQQIEDQIKAIDETGYSGYMVWYGFGSPDSLDTNKEGYIE